MTYSANAVYRLTSPKCPWSYYASGGRFVARKISRAKNPSELIMVFDSAHSWDLAGPDPFTLFYTWVTLEHYAGTSYYPMDGYWRHRRSNYGPFGNFAFLDGHVAGGYDYLKTCMDSNGYSESLANRWWGFE